MILGIHHAAISTPDLERALAFYCGVLGFEEMMKAGWPQGAESIDRLMGLEGTASKVALIKKGQAMIELFEFETPAPRPADPDRPVHDHGITHLCLDVRDLDKEVERLSAAGMRFHSEPVDTGPTRCVYGRDPDGNVIELQEFKSADDPLALRHPTG